MDYVGVLLWSSPELGPELEPKPELEPQSKLESTPELEPKAVRPEPARAKADQKPASIRPGSTLPKPNPNPTDACQPSTTSSTTE